MMTHDPEALLREAMSAHTSGVRADAAFVQATLDRSVASVRRARLRRFALTAGCAAAVAALAVWQLPTVTDRSEPPPTSPTTDDVIGHHAAYAWAQSLPRGADAEVAYVLGHTLAVGGHRVDVRLDTRRDLQLIDALPLGWFAVTSRNGAHMQYGSLTDYGEFGVFGYLPKAGDRLNGAVASPTGRFVAYGGAVLATGHPGGEWLPHRVATLYDWTPAGIAYGDQRDRLWLWSPGDGASERIAFDHYVSGGWGYSDDGDCVVLGRIASGGSATQRLCGDGYPLTVSERGFGGPDGGYVVMSSGHVVTVEGAVSFLTIPPDVLLERFALMWEADDTLLIVIHDWQGSTERAVFVRCLISAGRCERASDRLIGYPSVASLPD